MAKEICISTTPHETRLAILEDEQLAEIYYERENEYTLAGSIYKGKVTRVLPGMQSSFVDVGLERDAFLYVTDFLEDQEDSEDYETSSAGGSPRRAAERPAAEDAAVPAPAVAAAAGDEQRRGRRGGRGERGRGERTPEAATERGAEKPAEQAPRPKASEERALVAAALKTAEPSAVDRDEKGDEETPEGTRRWRGRRGRRRGGMRAGVLGTGGRTEEPLPQTATAPFALPEHGAVGGEASGLPEPYEEAAGLGEEPEPETINLQASAAPATNSGRSGERQPRERHRDRSPEHGRESSREQAREGSRAAAEPASSTRGRQEDAAPAAIILPGESLSKYGQAPGASAVTAPAAKLNLPTRPVNYVAPTPTTQVEVLSGWDGGSVLPGESLSRYKAPAATPAPVSLDEVAAESAPAPASGDVFAEATDGVFEASPEAESMDIAAEHDATSPDAPAYDAISHDSSSPDAPGHNAAGEDGNGSSEIAASADEQAVEHAVAAAALTGPETVAEALPGVEHGETITTNNHPLDAETKTAQAVSESEAAVPGSPDMPTHETATDEYEPEDGAASVRLSTPTSNELRLARFFGGGAPAASTLPENKLPPVTATPAEDQPVAAAHAESPRLPEDTTRFTLEAGSEAISEMTLEAEMEAEMPSPESGPSLQEAAAPVHEELEHSLPEDESLSPLFGRRFADEPDAEPAESLHSFDSSAAPATAKVDSITQMIDQLQGFAPGSGLLEEEVIDEDEYDFDPIHLHADELDLEDLEEETLDGDEEHDGAEEGEFAHEEAEQDAAADDERALISTRNLPRMEDLRTDPEEDDEEDEDPAAFALEEVDGDEDEAAPAVAGETQRRERTGEDRARRGGRNGRRRGGPGSGGGSNGGGGRRQSAQTQDLPIISDLLKQGQEILVQIAKEPIAKKGARITSHIALPGRFLVFMPTVGHVGVSRKIASDEERQRLKRILISEKGESSGGFIVRTAAEDASEEELRADLRFLISLWTEIKQRSETAKAPALIYHDLNLVERILRDQVSSNFSTIWVDTEQEYERIVRFLNRFQPALVRRVKLYTKETPLFEHFGIQEEISKALKSKVWLKSGGSIVINQTEALVAIDINTGKYVGKTARLEDTIVKTNLDAIPEIVRQIRLRDLGGIIVIDFIDMDERKNRNRVLAALEEAMKVDRAPSKVLQFNDFGLVAITRKRVKQSLERTLSVTCETCAGTGMVKSPITVCNEIFIELRKMQKHLDGKDVMLRVNPEVVKQLKGSGGKWINEYEEMVGKTIIIKSDPSLHPEQFDIH